jgi:hypothetical protein
MPLAAAFVLSCAVISLVDVQPVHLSGTCTGHDCVLWAHGRGKQEWRWYWTTHQLDGAVVVNNVAGVDTMSKDSVREGFHFQLAAKVPYLFVVTIGDKADSLNLVASPDGTVVND